MRRDLITFARTNYILAELRKELGLEYETHVKWTYSGFNGAGLTDAEKIKFGTVLFHEKKLEYNQDDCKEIQVNDFWVVVDSPNSHNVEKVINNANNEFENLIRKGETGILSRVKRFFLVVHFQKVDLIERVEIFIQDIVMQFPKAELFKSFERFPPLEIPIETVVNTTILYYFEVEVVFEEFISDDILIKVLQRFIPKIKEPIYGFGFLGGYDEISGFPIHIHLYARQF